jgi:hypothetical protein
LTRAGRFLLDPSLNTRNGEISRNIEKALAHATRKAINEVLARDHPDRHAIDLDKDILRLALDDQRPSAPVALDRWAS